MRTIDVSCLEFFEFHNINTLADDIIKNFKNNPLTFDDNNISKNLDKISHLDELFNWVYLCLDKVVENLKSDSLSVYKNQNKIILDNNNLASNYNMVISDCWVNRQQLGDIVPFHFHSMSSLSGIFYLDNSITPTEFLIPNYTISDNSYLFKKLPNFFKKKEIKPEKGKLIIFPSHISHGVPMHREPFVRHTIAFNMFLNGNISTSVGTFLSVEVKDIRNVIR